MRDYRNAAAREADLWERQNRNWWKPKREPISNPGPPGKVPTCSAKTAKGLPCQGGAKNNTDVCGPHLDQRNARNRAAFIASQSPTTPTKGAITT